MTHTVALSLLIAGVAAWVLSTGAPSVVTGPVHSPEAEDLAVATPEKPASSTGARQPL